MLTNHVAHVRLAQARVKGEQVLQESLIECNRLNAPRQVPLFYNVGAAVDLVSQYLGKLPLHLALSD